jgi:toxin-antitoxin system PIN domain toxin
VSPFLLDANLLIAAVVREHVFHDRVSAWLAAVDRVAVCPVTEGAVIRFLLRVGESRSAAVELLRLVRERHDCDFWPDSVSYVDADLTGVVGHRQVTDAYLVALATSRGARLATIDVALATLRPEGTLLIPE